MGLSGTEQYLRVATLVATSSNRQKTFQGLRVRFHIEKVTESTTNSTKIEIFNLSQESRTFMESGNLHIELSAGYPSKSEILFSGDVTKAFSMHQYPDWITSIEAGDGHKALTEKHVDISFKPGTPYQAIFLQALNSLGVTLGPNLLSVSAIATGGFSFSGTAKELLDKLAKQFGLEWSIQDEAVQVTDNKTPVPGTAVVIHSKKGLVGNVIKTDKQIEFKNLINGEIKPGRLISVSSNEVNGFYKVRKAVFDGDTHEGDWFVKVEAEAVS